jgi:hypothetical protein
MSSRSTTASHIPSPRTIQPGRGEGSSSWLSLLAATTNGLEASPTVRARIHANIRADQSTEPLRLVVHSYDVRQLRDGEPVAGEARPRASSQRAVTREQLHRGIVVDMLPTKWSDDDQSSFIVYAWLEKGRPDLEFDALLARPTVQAFRGLARTHGGSGSMSADLELTAA